jgi:hypothetical protein
MREAPQLSEQDHSQSVRKTASARHPHWAQQTASFAGTDGFAYFCHNKSRSPKAQQGILSTSGKHFAKFAFDPLLP